MHKVDTEVLIIGSGSTAIFLAHRLEMLNIEWVLINPSSHFGIGDIRPYDGLGLWNKAYRSDQKESLSELYDQLESRLSELYPAPIEQSGLSRREYWSILSSMPAHRLFTQQRENEFFKLERKSWSSKQFHLVDLEHAIARTQGLNMELKNMKQIEGAITRTYSIWWDAVQMGVDLSQFIHNKFSDRCFLKADIKSRYGKRMIVTTQKETPISIESRRAILVCLTGDLLPHLKSMVTSCDESWIQGIRKRRREQNFAWFQQANIQKNDAQTEPIWIELGPTHYYWENKKNQTNAMASWSSKKGPDGLERAVAEGLKLYNSSFNEAQFNRTTREFWLEWEWKSPAWRQTNHDTFWATAYEGDLYSSLELLWNLPLQ